MINMDIKKKEIVGYNNLIIASVIIILVLMKVLANYVILLVLNSKKLTIYKLNKY